MFFKKPIFLVLDIEQSCWNKNEQPLDEIVEIIEFGWSLLNVETWQVGEPQSIVIKPQNSKISEYCTNLTGITRKEARSGIIWQHAAKYLIKEGIKQYPVLMWGDDNIDILNNCKLYDTEIPISESTINLGMLYSMLHHDRSMGLKEAMLLENVSYEEDKPFHRAGNDAYYTAKVALEVFKRI